MHSALNPRSNLQAFQELLLLLTRHRTLTLEMARREIGDRYTGQVFGLFWAIGHPLILTLVYLFVFRFVFRMKVGGTVDMPLDYTAYMLSGLIPWMTFQEAMTKGCVAITGNANVVKQVIFPIEVLPVKGVVATLFTQLILLTLLVVYVLVSHGSLPLTYLLLPIPVVLQALAMIGVTYILAAVAPYFRDIKDFVQVFTVAGIYLIPLFYVPESVPTAVRGALYLNPFSYLLWCYQDVLYFGRPEHPWAWLILAVMSLAVFTIGYRFFRKLKAMFGNVL